MSAVDKMHPLNHLSDECASHTWEEVERVSESWIKYRCSVCGIRASWSASRGYSYTPEAWQNNAFKFIAIPIKIGVNPKYATPSCAQNIMGKALG